MTVLYLKYIPSGIFMTGIPLCVMLYTVIVYYCVSQANDDTF